MYTPHTPALPHSKTGVYRVMPIILIFYPEHRLWVLDRTALPSVISTINVLSKNIKNMIFIAPAYSRVRYRSPNFCPFVRSSVRSFVRPSTFTSKFGFLDIRDSCESETLHSYCP